MQLYFSTDSNILQKPGLRRIQISILMLVTGICSCLGALHSEKILQRFGKNVKYIVSFAMGISILFVSGNGLVISVAAFFVAGYVNSLIYPIASAALNELIPSEQRATIISIDSMCFSIAMVFFFPGNGAGGRSMESAWCIFDIGDHRDCINGNHYVAL